ncbi:Vacuole effluxer Atg22-like protein [Fragilaria crotonensis]|nr:Vacuole effluxer Atg22-like protein [Fragilaria crotonensis]
MTGRKNNSVVQGHSSTTDMTSLMISLTDGLNDGDRLRKRTAFASDPSQFDEGITESKTYTRPPIFRLVPHVLRFDNSPTDATGLSLDYLARACIVMSTVFLGPALLDLSTQAAHCPNMQDCDERVFGMKPSSLLTNIAMLSGFLSAISMPLMGAVVDHTSYRKQVGSFTAYALSIVKGLETMISIDTWMYVAFCQVITGVLYSTHITVTYAYISELSKDTAEQTKYNSYYFVIMYVSILLFIAEVMFAATWIGTDTVGTAKVSQVLTCVSTTIYFVIGWTTLFTNRPPSTTLEDGQWLVTAGFIKLWKTSRHISSELPAMQMLMLSIMCSEAALATLVSIATTYMVHFLAMSTMEVGTAFLIILIMGIPGAKLGEWLALTLNPRWSAMLALQFFMVTTAMAAWVLDRPDRKQYMNIFGFLWGTGLGWLHPQNTTMFIALTPNHSQTEYMGIYNFAQSIIGWLPPLVFTIMNERGVEMNFGLASLNVFFFLSLIFLLFMGSIPSKEKAATVFHPNDVEAVLPELPTAS